MPVGNKQLAKEPGPNQSTEITVADIDRAPAKLPVDKSKLPTLEEYEGLLDRIGQLAEENSDLRDQNQKLRNRKEAAEELNKLIGPYANKAYWFMCGYCAVVGIFLFASGASFWGLQNFSLGEQVQEFLVGSTAATVIGLVGMVLTGIFVGARK